MIGLKLTTFTIERIENMKYVYGNDLTATMQQYVKAQFLHRFTGDHQPQWVREAFKRGKQYPLQFKDDAEWLSNTRFSFTNKGTLAKRSGCESIPTWPQGGCIVDV